jgi:hypothetical protein
MHTLKIGLLLAALLAGSRYLPVYYNSSEFSVFVKHEAARIQSESQLRQSLLEQARYYSLPVQESDISIAKADTVFRVSVDYKVPVNWFVWDSELTFHAAGAGLLQRSHD